MSHTDARKKKQKTDPKPATGEDKRAVCSLNGTRHESRIKDHDF